MTTPVDVQETTSRALSALLDRVIENYENQGEDAPTLASVRAAASGGLLARMAGDAVMRQYGEGALLSELDALVEIHGEEALAADFLRPRASEDLSTLIEAVMSSSRPNLRLRLTFNWLMPELLSSVRPARRVTE